MADRAVSSKPWMRRGSSSCGSVTQAGQAGVHDGLGESLLTILAGDRQVIEKASATVMAAEDGTDDAAVVPGDEAQAGVAGEEGVDGFAAVGGGQANAFTLSPSRSRSVHFSSPNNSGSYCHLLLYSKSPVSQVVANCRRN
jgi:hypothetical protein